MPRLDQVKQRKQGTFFIGRNQRRSAGLTSTGVVCKIFFLPDIELNRCARSAARSHWIFRVGEARYCLAIAPVAQLDRATAFQLKHCFSRGFSLSCAALLTLGVSAITQSRPIAQDCAVLHSKIAEPLNTTVKAAANTCRSLHSDYLVTAQEHAPALRPGEVGLQRNLQKAEKFPAGHTPIGPPTSGGSSRWRSTAENRSSTNFGNFLEL